MEKNTQNIMYEGRNVKTKQRFKEVIKQIIIGVCIICILIFVFIQIFKTLEKAYNDYTETTYQLSEVSDGNYAIYFNVISNVPAHNYDVVTLCCDGQIMTFKGTITITYTNDESYTIVSTNKHRPSSAKVQIYVPSGTVLYQPSVGIMK